LSEGTESGVFEWGPTLSYRTSGFAKASAYAKATADRTVRQVTAVQREMDVPNIAGIKKGVLTPLIPLIFVHQH